MPFKNTRWWLLALACIGGAAQAATYYVANGGDDARDGLSPATAWRSLDQVNAFAFADGDRVLFRRGDTFRGGINTARFPRGLTFAAYGAGDAPVLSGALPITGWRRTTHPALDPQRVWEADVSTLPLTDRGIEHLFADGRLLTIARFPNVPGPKARNWLNVDASPAANQFSDQALAGYARPAGYWAGATLRIRNYSWTYTVRNVTGYDPATGTLTYDGSDMRLLPEWGYFLDGKLGELDFADEWFYDAAAHKVYFQPPAGQDPNGMLVEGSTFADGIRIAPEEHRTTVKELAIRQYTNNCLIVTAANRVTVSNNAFSHCGQAAVYLWNPVDATVSGNTISDSLQEGVILNAEDAFDVGASVVSSNRITDTAMFPGYGDRWSGTYNGIGINAFGSGFTIRRNTVRNTGWCGIYLADEGRHVVERNVVRDSLLLLNDGGGIAISSNGNRIRQNFILDTYGSVNDGSDGWSSMSGNRHASYGMGIGANSGFRNNQVIGNTIAGNRDWAIRFNGFTGSRIEGNTLFNNESQILLEDTHAPSANNVVTGNTIYSGAADQIAVRMTHATEHGALDNNRYCNPYSPVLFSRDDRRYGLGHWQSAFGQDASSTACAWRFKEYATRATAPEMLGNTRFDTGVGPWLGGVFDPGAPGMSGGSLKFTNQGATGFVSHSGLMLQAGQSYRLRFRIRGSRFGNVQLRINDADPAGWVILAERFFAYTRTAANHEFVFQAPRTTSLGQVMLISRDYDAPAFWLDDVSLLPVEATPNPSPAELFSNTTARDRTIHLSGAYTGLDGSPVGASITLASFTSRILVRQ